MPPPAGNGGGPLGEIGAPVGYVRAILLGYARYGKDPEDALRRARIPPATAREAHATIGARRLEALAAAARRDLDDEALGWFSVPLRWGTYGMLCRASLTSPDLGVALKRWFRHHALIARDIELELQVRGHTATVAIHERSDLGATRDYCTFWYLRFIHRFACWAIDTDIALASVRFACARPPCDGYLRAMFPCTLAYEAPRASLAFDARLLSSPLCRNDDALRAMLDNAHALEFLQYRHDQRMVQRVQGLLRGTQDGGASAGAIAARLHVSSRTLSRQLRAEGASFRQAKDGLRRDRALRLLRETDRPLKTIASSLGYANDKSFSKAFRAWTGETPARYRRRRRLGPE